MGYETRLIIGKPSCVTSKEFKRGDLIIDGQEAYRPYLKDENDNYIETGRIGVWFEVMAMVDLCKAGYDTNIAKVDWKNTDKNIYWYFYGGYGSSEEVTEDCYGDSSKPIPISVVLEALKKDYENDDYRRFKWAIAILESMQDDSENLQVLFYGH